MIPIKPTRQFFSKSLLFLWALHHKLLLFFIVLLALVLIVLRLTTLYLESNPELIHSYIKSELQHSISFDDVSVDINPLYPSIAIHNVQIKDDSGEKNIISFAYADLQLDVLLSLFRGKVVINELLLDGLELLVQRENENEISVAGIKFDISGDDTYSADILKDPDVLKLLNQHRLIISNSKVTIVDKMQEFSTNQFTNIHFSIKNKGLKHQLKLQTQLNKINTRLDLRFDLMGRLEEPENLSGKFYGLIDKLSHRTIEGFIKEDVFKVDNYQLEHLNANAKVWAKIKQGQFYSAQGQFIINESELMRIDNGEIINLYDLKSNFKLAGDALQMADSVQRDDIQRSSDKRFSEKETPSLLKKNWSVDIFNLNFSVEDERFIDQRIYINNSVDKSEPLSTIKLFLNKLELGKLSPFYSFFLIQQDMKKEIQAMSPSGQVENIIVSLSIPHNSVSNTLPDFSQLPEDSQIQADLIDVSISTSLANGVFASIPTINKLSGQLIINKERGNVSIDSKNTDLFLHSLFRDAWPVEQLSGEVYWQKDEQDWLLGINNIQFANQHLNINADLKLWFLENESVFLDLTAFFSVADVSNVPYYLPSKIMSDGLVDWLDNAFDAGSATDGGVIFRGQLNQFPFADRSGVLDISFNAEDVQLEYQKDWPKLNNIDAFIQFTEKGMIVESHHAEVFSAVSHNINANLEDYMKPVLKVNGDIQANIKDALKYLQQSSLVSQEVIEMLDAEGEININLDLNIPTDGGLADTKVLVSFKDADYYPPGLERKKGMVSHLKGNLMVHNNKINAKNISASIMNSPARLSIKTSKSLTKKNKEPSISILLNSKMSLGQFEQFNLLPKKFTSLKNYISGDAHVFATIHLPNEEQAFSLNINTDLKGLSSELPLPFNKKSHEKIALKGRYSEFSSQSIRQSQLNIDYADKLSLVLLLNNQKKGLNVTKAHLAFAPGPAKLPEKNVLKITGRVLDTPFKEWMTLLESLETEKLSLKPVRQDAFLPVELEITELILAEPDFIEEHEKGLIAAESIDVEKAETLSDMEPADFPLINGSIQSIKLGKTKLGKLSIASSRVDKDIVFDKLRLEGELFTFKGKAVWNHWHDVAQVNLEGDMSIPSIELFMKAFYLDPMLEKGKAEISGFLKWPGAPGDLNKKNVTGNLKIEVENGSFIDAKPGPAGRLLGLINLNELSRRIKLDFSDVKDEGFAFDRISGDFRFLNANIYTDNLRVFSPSANLLISGRTGMLAKDFEQKVLVIPEISATLPIAGAVVAGPAGAAIAWLGQKLLGDEINKISAFSYTVTGAWNDPKIERSKTNTIVTDDIKSLLDTDGSTMSKTEKKQADNKVNNPLFETDF